MNVDRATAIEHVEEVLAVGLHPPERPSLLAAEQRRDVETSLG